ncbi:2-succinylbenzoate--CoA ligase [Streptomyces alboniger]
MWLAQLLERNRQCFPGRTALVDEDRSVTWAEFHDRTAQLARGPADLGIERGDRVAVLSKDRIEVLESYFALARLGALFVPLNHSLAEPEVTGIIERVGAIAVIGESELLDRYPRLPDTVRIRLALDKPSFEALGTRTAERDLPAPQRALAAVERHRATHMWMVPQMLRFMLRAKASHRTDLSSLREILYGAAPMPLDVYADAVQRLGCGFRQVYGMTEVGGPFVTLGPDEHPAPGDVTARIPCGRVVPGMSARAVDEAGRELPPGETGEIVVRGPGLMQGYWNDPAATREITADGWIRTGDLGFLDEEGRISLVDRTKDVIIRAGQNVYPSEIERALMTHLAVRDTAVVGMPDEDYGEVPLAYVVLEPDGAPDSGTGTGAGAAELLAHVAGMLAPYKRPRRVEFIEQVPRNPAGKIVKKLLRV